MFKDTQAFSGFSVQDLDATKQFYGDILGIDVEQTEMGLKLNIAGGNPIFVYPKENHEPATYTILNFPVADIDVAVEELSAKGAVFEQYDNVTDEKGVARGVAANHGPDIAWFKDPAGNILSVLNNG